MTLTIQLTSHSDPSRGETERMAEIFTVKFRRNGDRRDEFLRALAADIKRLADEHNARFERAHGGG